MERHKLKSSTPAPESSPGLPMTARSSSINAGTALNLAKAEGGNCHVVFAHEMQTAVDERNQLR